MKYIIMYVLCWGI